MSNLAIPSKTVLFQKEKAIRSIQELYEHVSKLEDSGGGYIKPEEGIPASDMTEEVQESLAKADSALQQHQDISGKVDKTTTVNGHALSNNVTVTKGDVGLGNVTNDAQIPLTQKGANNGVATLGSTGKIPTSQLPDAIMTGKEDKMTVVTTTSTNLSCTLGSYYVFSSAVNTLRITLPSPSDNTYVGNVILYFTTGSSPAVTITSSKSIAYQTDYAIEAECTYEVNCLYNGGAWVVIAVQIGG